MMFSGKRRRERETEMETGTFACVKEENKEFVHDVERFHARDVVVGHFHLISFFFSSPYYCPLSARLDFAQYLLEPLRKLPTVFLFHQCFAIHRMNLFRIFFLWKLINSCNLIYNDPQLSIIQIFIFWWRSLDWESPLALSRLEPLLESSLGIFSIKMT